MFKKLNIAALLFVLALTGVWFALPADVEAKRGEGPIIYVTSQGLYYDSIVTADPLPPRGRFQKLEVFAPDDLRTEFGPGDQEYVGGRWWVDLNGNNEMDADDHYFSCPLLGPGRTSP